ncbi:sensor histidine kinase [Aidingimonas halophila]|uniref:histidine kinase n=1 Tax=Aidingimonas halophila TaxID=574349 RepID=A0A1H2RM57_9GAMM|nr:sensor histidine kinase [Aidingimonas halophila]GHC18988.1 two-component sensor [Aidingimonas halophila]SDW20573.1 Signal transduction histidine kinase [Aidingimonas halophila]
MFRIDRRSLRFRLLVWLTGTALVVVGAAWVLHGFLLRELAKDFLGERLQREADHAVRQLQQESETTPAMLDSVSQGYQVFHHLYVLELDDEVSASEARWQTALKPYLDNTDDALIEVVWEEHRLLVYRRGFSLDDSDGVLLVGEEFSQVEAGLDTLHWWVGAIAGVLLVLLIALNLVAVHRGLVPLKHLQGQLMELRTGRRQRLALNAPSELDGLVTQLNRFMDEIDTRLQRGRDSAANLSHALKTPLAAVTQVLRGGRPINENRREKLLQRLEDIHGQLEAEIRRSWIAGPSAGQLACIPEDVHRLIDTFRMLYPDKWFHLTINAGDSACIPIERHDFSEMLGIPLDNAGKWASREIECHLSMGSGLTIVIEDDGPGISRHVLPKLAQRGVRLDESHPGHGLGLSILSQLMDRYEGGVAFDTGTMRGLKVTITIPCHEP